MKKKTRIIIIFLICMGLMISATAIAVRFDIVSMDKLGSIFTSVDKQDDIIEEKNIAPITTENNPPEAKFTYSNELYTVTFLDQSSDVDNDPLSYLWYFGDGTNSIEQNPVYTYDCSKTNSFDVVLKVNDGELYDTYKHSVLFAPHLNILDYSQVWKWDDIFYEEWYIYEPVWAGTLSMTVENTGNMPTEISYAKIETIERSGDYPLHQGSIYFSFTYLYYETVEGDEDGDGMLGSELVVGMLSNNTLTLNPGETVTLTSNPELTDLTWDAGSYPVRIWLYEQKNGKDFSHTMYETTVVLSM